MLAYVAILTGAALVALATGLALSGVLRAVAVDPRPAFRPRHSRSAARRATTARSVRLDDYGLLRTVALVENLEAGRSVCDLLAAGGVRATVAVGSDGLTRVLVFPHEYDEARRMVSWTF